MNLNKVLIAGNMTRDPELRQTPSGQAVCNFSIATNRVYNDASGQRQQQTEFHNIVAWGRQGEVVNQYMKKGRLILVEGRLQTRSWQDQQGSKRYRTEVIADRIQLGPQRVGGGDFSSSQGDPNTPPAPDAPAPPYAPSQDAPQDAPPVINLSEDGEEIDVKDIPF